MPNRRWGFRNQSGRTPSSETRFKTPLEPTIAVLTAPERIRKPTNTTSAFNDNRAQYGPTTFIARPPIKLPPYFATRGPSGMIITAKKLISDGECQTIDKDDERGLLEIEELGAFHLAIDLRERLLAAHRQDRVAEGDRHADQPEHAEPVSGHAFRTQAIRQSWCGPGIPRDRAGCPTGRGAARVGRSSDRARPFPFPRRSRPSARGRAPSSAAWPVRAERPA